jgi:hypothetical protein
MLSLLSFRHEDFSRRRRSTRNERSIYRLVHVSCQFIESFVEVLKNPSKLFLLMFFEDYRGIESGLKIGVGEKPLIRIHAGVCGFTHRGIGRATAVH